MLFFDPAIRSGQRRRPRRRDVHGLPTLSKDGPPPTSALGPSPPLRRVSGNGPAPRMAAGGSPIPNADTPTASRARLARSCRAVVARRAERSCAVRKRDSTLVPRTDCVCSLTLRYSAAALRVFTTAPLPAWSLRLPRGRSRILGAECGIHASHSFYRHLASVRSAAPRASPLPTAGPLGCERLFHWRSRL